MTLRPYLWTSLLAALLAAAPATPAAAGSSDKPRVQITDADVAHVAPASAAPAAKPDSKVILYATAWCGYCRKTRELFKSLDVAYVEKDIEKDEAGRKEYQAKGKGYQGVPLIDVGGLIVKGYSPEEIRRGLDRLRRGQPAVP
jgi:mycoredoxin